MDYEEGEEPPFVETIDEKVQRKMKERGLALPEELKNTTASGGK